MNEAEANDLRAQLQHDMPYVTCEVRPRIHTGTDDRAADADDAWAVVVTNNRTGIVVNLTSMSEWQQQILPARM